MKTDSKQSWLNLAAALVALSGIFTLGSTLFALKHLSQARIVIADAHFTLIAGLSLVYLAMTLRRGKRNAWFVALAVFGFLLTRNIRHFVFDIDVDRAYLFHLTTQIILPTITVGLLIFTKKLFRVKSEILNFSIALRRAVIILGVAFLYGVIGFQVFDHKDFHQEISLPAAAHYTIDQFGLTNKHITAHTKRSLFFVDSLAAVSVASAFYAAIAFFAPTRFKLSHHQHEYETALAIVGKTATTSEDFFKLWPKDKAYFFNSSQTALIAYKTAGGAALAVGDPLGPRPELKQLIRDFEDYCSLNDWQSAFIHSEPTYQKLYKSLGYESQKIGEEAIIDIDYFVENVMPNKYFRHIKNKFDKLGYSCQLVSPPHSPELLADLKDISNDWLSAPGRTERGFMMGYFSNDYMQLCNLLIVKDEAGLVQGFINELPIHNSEANFDFLRHKLKSPGNINDYLMLNFINDLARRQIKTLNMGLAPLAGLEDSSDNESQLLNAFLNFAYQNTNRFYSFQGLARFKSKYEPNWQSRYIVYKGGLRGFSKTMNGLMRAMRV